MNILVFAGSLRKASYNKKLAKEISLYLKQKPEHNVVYVDLENFHIPVYNGDIEESHGIPMGVKSLGKLVREADALIISTPEYNSSIPGAFKNVIDWLSRERPVSLKGKHLFLTAASISYFGGIRSLWATRVPFEYLGVFVFPDMIGLAHADKAFSTEGKLLDETFSKKLYPLIDQYLEYLEKTLSGRKDETTPQLNNQRPGREQQPRQPL